MINIPQDHKVPLFFERFPVFRCGRRPSIRMPLGLRSPCAQNPHFALHQQADLIGYIEVLRSIDVGLASDVVVAVLPKGGEFFAPSLPVGIRTTRLGIGQKVAGTAHIVRLAVDEKVLALRRELDESHALAPRIQHALAAQENGIHTIQIRRIRAPQARRRHAQSMLDQMGRDRHLRAEHGGILTDKLS